MKPSPTLSVLAVLFFLGITLPSINAGIPDIWPTDDPSVVWEKDEELGESVNLYCGTTSVVINVTEDYINLSGVKYVDDLVMLDNDGNIINDTVCGGFVENGDIFSKAIVGDFGKCARLIESTANDTDLYVHYRMCVIPQAPLGAVINRDFSVTIDFKCAYYGDVIASMDLKPQVISQEIDVAADSSEFEMEMNRYNDMLFDNVSSSLHVKVGDQVIVGVRLNNGSDNRLLLLSDLCWVSPNETSMSPIDNDVVIIMDGCPVSDSLGSGGNVVLRQDEDFFGFSFTSFYWSEHANWPLFVHCKMSVCDTEGGDCVQPECNKRRKRSSKNPKKLKSSSPDQQRHVVFGPLSSISDNECFNADLGCSHLCGKSAEGKCMCVCPYGYVLDSDEKTCTDIRHQPEGESDIQLELALISNSGSLYNVVYYLIIATTMLVVFVLCLCIYNAKQTRQI